MSANYSLVLATTATMLVGARATWACPQGSDGETGSGGGCAVSESWIPYSIHANWSVSVNGQGGSPGVLGAVPISGSVNEGDPLLLRAEAFQIVYLDVNCDGCDDHSNRFIELDTNIEYEFSILNGPGNLSRVANDSSVFSQVVEAQQVLYHPPPLQPGMPPVIVEIEYHVENDDIDANEPKDVPLNRSGIIHLELTTPLLPSPRSFDPIQLMQDQTAASRSINVVDFWGFVTGGEELNDPGPEEVAEECFAQWEWLAGDTISFREITVGDEFLGAPFPGMTHDVYTADILAFEAFADDHDVVRMWCKEVDDCGDSASKFKRLPDTIRYEYRVIQGGATIRQSNRDRDVLIEFGRQPGTVLVEVTARDSGLQAVDTEAVFLMTFNVLDSRRLVRAAVISTVHAPDVALPGIDVGVPMAALGQTFEAHFADQPFPSVSDHVYRWTSSPTRPGYWEYGLFSFVGSSFTQSADQHPWFRATQLLAATNNPPPVNTFGSIDDIQTRAVGKDIRHLFLWDLALLGRREIVLEVLENESRLNIDEGWTPNRQVPYEDRMKLFAATGQRNTGTHNRGEYKPSERFIFLSGEGTDQIALGLGDVFALGEKGDQAQQLVTNRHRVFIEVETYLEAGIDETVSPTNLQLLPDPNFPTHWIYLDTDDDGSLDLDRKTTPIPTWDFLNLGKRVNPKGV